jgi:hypothetical protein
LPMKMEQIECSETSAYKIQTPGNHPEENIQQTVPFFVAAEACTLYSALSETRFSDISTDTVHSLQSHIMFCLILFSYIIHNNLLFIKGKQLFVISDVLTGHHG